VAWTNKPVPPKNEKNRHIIPLKKNGKNIGENCYLSIRSSKKKKREDKRTDRRNEQKRKKDRARKKLEDEKKAGTLATTSGIVTAEAQAFLKSARKGRPDTPILGESKIIATRRGKPGEQGSLTLGGGGNPFAPLLPISEDPFGRKKKKQRKGPAQEGKVYCTRQSRKKRSVFQFRYRACGGGIQKKGEGKSRKSRGGEEGCTGN